MEHQQLLHLLQKNLHQINRNLTPHLHLWLILQVLNLRNLKRHFKPLHRAKLLHNKFCLNLIRMEMPHPMLPP